MESVQFPEQKISIKIGLILLVLVLYFIGLFIYSLTLKKKIDLQKEEMDNAYKVLSSSNDLIISVQQAQDVLNKYLTSPGKNYNFNMIPSPAIYPGRYHISKVCPRRAGKIKC